MDFTVDILPQEKLLSQASRHTECVPEPLSERKTKSILRNIILCLPVAFSGL
jgi:hypothetical protein